MLYILNQRHPVLDIEITVFDIAHYEDIICSVQLWTTQFQSLFFVLSLLFCSSPPPPPSCSCLIIFSSSSSSSSSFFHTIMTVIYWSYYFCHYFENCYCDHPPHYRLLYSAWLRSSTSFIFLHCRLLWFLFFKHVMFWGSSSAFPGVMFSSWTIYPQTKYDEKDRGCLFTQHTNCCLADLKGHWNPTEKMGISLKHRALGYAARRSSRWPINNQNICPLREIWVALLR